MSSTFIDEIRNKTNYTYTENGAIAKKTTNSDVLDLFARGGALRNQSQNEIKSIFDRAYCEDRLLALKTAFYIRDIRGGQGERRTFRIILKHISERTPEVLLKNINLIPEYGRWDDLYSLFDTKLEEEVTTLMFQQLIKDMNSDFPSLLAKWLKSENASFKGTKRLAQKTRKAFGWTPRKYRKTLSTLREKLRIVERKMSAGNWEEINYGQVPSKAAMIYKNAFMRHDPKGYETYIRGLEKGEEKINASTLYPYELVREAYKDLEYNLPDLKPHERKIINEQWKALPDYIGEKSENSIAVVDTSGSMSGLPIQVALSVGLYLAEHNNGPYKDKFITFSNKPELIEVKGTTFCDKVANMNGAHWEMNTDIEAVFDLILNVALNNHLHQNELPKKLYIISDMEFDDATGRWDKDDLNKTLFNEIKIKFNKANYIMPDLVFWNVDSRNQQFPMSINDRGFQLVSGCNPSIFEYTMKGEFLSAYDFMLQVINSERYEKITI